MDACAEARCRAVILFDRDLPSGGARNIESATQLASLIAHVRARLGQGVIVAIDQEGGKVARLSPSKGFAVAPSAEEFAALPDEAQRAVAAAQARQLGRFGIDLNFAPCVDVARAYGCSVIEGLGRAYSMDAQAVVRCARVVIEAHLAEGVTACIKHFPGHGGASGDSHVTLPDITDSHDSAIDLASYEALIPAYAARGLCVMVGHLAHDRIDSARPASLSSAWIDGLLRQSLRFGGLVVTDSLDMGALRSFGAPDRCAALALAAGADLVVDANNGRGDARPCPAPAMARAIRRAIDKGDLEEDRVVLAAERIDAVARDGVR